MGLIIGSQQSSSPSSAGAVRYDTPQSLTATQKQRARLNIGVSELVDNIVNDLVTGGVDKALSAEMGKQLKIALSSMALGKFYGFYATASELPSGSEAGYAYVGSENPYLVYNYNGASWTNSGTTIDNSIEIVNNLTAGGTDKALSAEMGKYLGSGYRYGGVVTLQSSAITPVGKIFVVAAEVGTYTRFGNLTVEEGELAFFSYDNSWIKEAVHISVTIVNNLTAGGTTKALSAEMGKQLNLQIIEIQEQLQNLINNLAPIAFKPNADTGNPVFMNMAIFPSETNGSGVIRFGHTENASIAMARYCLSPVFDLGEIGDEVSLRFSCGEVKTGSNHYPNLTYLDENGDYYSYHEANANPRTINITVSQTLKKVRLFFRFEKLIDAYLYNVTTGRYLFKGSDVAISAIKDEKVFMQSQFMLDAWKPNAQGDYIGYNFGTSDSYGTNQRYDINYPISKKIGTSHGSEFSFGISKIIEIPSGCTKLQFSCGEVNTSLMLRALIPSSQTADYWSANANPRTVDVGNYTHVQLYFHSAHYAQCFIKDVTHNEMLWEGLSE